ncbi:MAG TPA: hypothetical protein G4O00_13720, partial [Thermoflexia bacterium]|nr:hypothetical protein [Thermoflexia bacterium]
VEWLHFPPREGKWAWGFSSACRARLRLLWQAGYLDRLWPDRFHGPAVYTLDRRGVEALAAYRGFPSDGLIGRGRKELSPLFLEHALDVARVYAAVAAALREVPEVHLADFRGEHTFRGPGDHDRFPDPADPRRTLPVVPDGLFVLERADGKRRLVFLEVDRGTMAVRRVRGKVRGYGGYRVGEGPGRFRARFGHPPVFVVTWVGRDRRGKERLREVVGEEWARWSGTGGGVVHLFHALPDLTPETALGWEDGEGRKVSLLGRR